MVLATKFGIVMNPDHPTGRSPRCPSATSKLAWVATAPPRVAASLIRASRHLQAVGPGPLDPGDDPADIERKRAVIAAALARSRAKRGV